MTLNETKKKNDILHSNTPSLLLSSLSVNGDKVNLQNYNKIPSFHLLHSPYMSAKFDSERPVFDDAKPEGVNQNQKSAASKHEIRTMVCKGRLAHDRQVKGYYIKDKKDQDVVLYVNVPKQKDNAIGNALAFNKKRFLQKKKLAQKKKIWGNPVNRNFFSSNVRKRYYNVTHPQEIVCGGCFLFLQACKKNLIRICYHWKNLNFLYGLNLSTFKISYFMNRYCRIPCLTLNELFQKKQISNRNTLLSNTQELSCI
ncbi:uncharacterized protein LOC128883758 [Hylaeus volcanicus]|uniref:uncharacterized protein LOC128883758 n=1 Tax=Hylaeus volcanicus TaxID=313075 RepID=UPI0023B79DE2|nr:uncharacterized protein LOC128883758 [Hylaeus volcanicus]